MRKLLFLLCFLMAGSVSANFLGIKQSSETISFFLNKPLDSLYGIPRSPDSVHLFTYADNATAYTYTARSTTFPFSDISIDTLKHWTDTMFIFADAISDIDGAGGNFSLAIEVQMYYDDIPTTTHAVVQIVSDSLENFLDASKDSSSSAAVLSKNNLDSLQSQDGWVAKDANFDTLRYQGYRGFGIFIDSAAANTNTVIGVDGTPKNPVSTIAAAKTLATALGSNRYYLINQSTFNAAGTDLPSIHDNWEIIGLGHNTQLAFGGQSVDGSFFYNIELTGAMHASGSDAIYERCRLGYVSANYGGHALDCEISDTLVMRVATNIEFDGCWSGVAGNNTPTLDLSAGSSAILVRHYSGGLRFMSGTTLDTVSIETDGQIIISANNTSLHVSARGNMIVTDSGTTTDLTRNAALSSGYIATIQMDTLEASTTRDVALKSLVISNSAGDAVQFTATGGNGDGLQILGNSTGHGIHALGGTFSDGIHAIGGGTGGHGLSVTGQGAGGRDVSLEGNGYISSATDTIQNRSDSLINQGSASSLTKEAVADAVMDSLEAGVGRDVQLKSIVVSNSAGDAVQFTSTGTNGDGLQITGNGSGNGLNSVAGASGDGIYAVGGNTSGTGQGITAQAGATAGHGFQIVGTSTGDGMRISASGTGNDISLEGNGFIASATDTVPMRGDSLIYQGSASSLTKEAIIQAWIDSIGAGTVAMAIQSLKIKNTTTNDTALVVESHGTAPGMAVLGGVSGKGSEFKGGASSGGAGIQATGGGSDGSYGVYIASGATNGGGAQFVSPGTGYLDIYAPDYANAVADSVKNDSVAYKGSPSGWDATDSTVFKGLVDDTLKKAHQDSDWGATGSSGSGAVSIRVEATDTTGVDSNLVAGVSVTVRKMTGALDALQVTNTSGNANFTLPAESLIFLGNKSGYTFFTDTVLISVADTIILLGNRFLIAPTPPVSANVCTVYGWVRNYKALTKKYMEVKFTTPQATWNTCDSTILFPDTYMLPINDTGYFSIDVIKSSCMETLNNGSLQEYKISIPGFRNTEHKFSIPSDSSTYKVVF